MQKSLISRELRRIFPSKSQIFYNFFLSHDEKSASHIWLPILVFSFQDIFILLSISQEKQLTRLQILNVSFKKTFTMTKTTMSSFYHKKMCRRTSSSCVLNNCSFIVLRFFFKQVCQEIYDGKLAMCKNEATAAKMQHLNPITPITAFFLP